MAGRPVDRHLFIVVGATGDLMERKLLPALYRLSPPSAPGDPPFRVLGASRRDWEERQFRAFAAAALARNGIAAARIARGWAERVLFFSGLGGDDRTAFARLGERAGALDREHDLGGNRVIYLALPSEALSATIRSMGRAGLHRAPGWTRLVLEKPFGRDLPTARKLNRTVHQFLPERGVYRIDHYLGKETVQNLLAFRFANMLFESVWNRDRIDHVEITVAEDLGVEHRAAYYDRTGALRDMVQSHLAQLLSLTAMEVPSSLEADQVRNEKVKVLRSIAPIRDEDIVLGQYGPGHLGARRVPGYRKEPGVRRTSRTETFVALRLFVNSWRWHGIPFLLRTGKRLPEKLTEIVVRFRAPPVWFFPSSASPEIAGNTLTITLQPDEGFDLGFEIKKPGHDIGLVTHRLHFRYAEAFGPLPEAYVTLLLDVMRGDQTLFVRSDEVEESWRVFDAVLAHPIRVARYPAGSWGPKTAGRIFPVLGAPRGPRP
ncbi:MAG TPA: glucose-6-phosphate dehydrogenase [Thermoplasmata archaeon]|nr:glucose-6-phosphate dehydrogenase [Thermoplasmata archaeon]